MMMPSSQSLCCPPTYHFNEEIPAQTAVRPRRYSSLRNIAATSEPHFNIGPRLNRVQPSTPLGVGQSHRERQVHRSNMEFNAGAAMKDGTFEWFLHKDISVITYQNIRYEGKLWSIDTANATIELQNVRNMGTEQRAASIKVQPASDSFGFIVFNVDLIKSFQPVIRLDGGGDYRPGGTPSPGIASMPGKGTAKMMEPRYYPNSGGGVHSLSKASGASAGFVTSTPIVKRFAGGPQGDGQRLRSIDVNRLVAEDRAVCRKSGFQQAIIHRYYEHSQQTHLKTSDSIDNCVKGARVKSSKGQSKDGDNGSGSSNSHGSRNGNSSHFEKDRPLKLSKDGNVKKGVVEKKLVKEKAPKASSAHKDEKTTRHVSFVTSEETAEGRPQGRRITHIPQVPRHFMSNSGGRGSSHGGRGHRPLNEAQFSFEAKSPSAPRRYRIGVQFKPGEFVKPKTTVKFKDEFDFDKALEEFKELSLNDSKGNATNSDSGTANGGIAHKNRSTDTPKEFYNREKCFYDNLSSTNVSDGKLRRSRKEEIMVNKETFGLSWIPIRRRYFSGHTPYYSYVGGRRCYAGRRSFTRR